LDFLVNFYQLGIDFLNLDRIKRIVGLVRYIDWVSLSPDSQSLMTKAVAEISNSSKSGVDPLTLSIIAESLSRLSKTTASSMAILKNLNTYYREFYKLTVRQKITFDMSAGDATLENIKKKMPSAMPGTPFYKELVEEIIKEDYSSSGQDLRDIVLNTIKVPTEKKKAAKAAVNFKNILLDGIQVIGGASTSLTEIVTKLDENQTIMEDYKKSFMQMIKELIRQITNAEPEEVVYNVEYMDQTKGIPVKDKVNFYQFREDLEKKIRFLASLMRGPAYQKLSAMTEEQIIGYLEKNITEMQNYHKTLSALDEFFKSKVNAENRGKIKGIKPELSALKNSYVKANQLRYEYSAQKEEEEQLKRLGVSNAPPPEAAGAAAAATANSGAPAGA
jgi:site-specific recombinase XerD